MTIDEYLNQIRSSNKESEYLYKRVHVLNDRLESLKSSLNVGDGRPGRSSYKEKREDLLAEWSDAIKACKAADQVYLETKNQLMECVYMLPYLEGSLIDQVFILNPCLDRDDQLYGLSEILNTDDRGVMISKLNAAKQHLRTLLIEKGIEIE